MKLKPCPFCGREVKKNCRTQDGWFLTCHHKDTCFLNGYQLITERAIESWIKREGSKALLDEVGGYDEI